ncbi:MAG: hypothetical protein ACMXYF_00860 [Candidatus Woesearchaeota archaeon]
MRATLTHESDIKQRLEDAGFKDFEQIEVRKDVKVYTGYPKPARRYRIDFESESHTVENMYYWIVGHAHNDFDMPVLLKIIDTHAASAASQVFGDMQQRLGAQQGNVSNYMATIGKLVKDIFALVRELRQVEERLGYYIDSYDKEKEVSARKHAEATLRDIWVSMVEGGSQNPGSVIGMAQKVGFTVLPDLFFGAAPVESEEDIEKIIKDSDFNETVLMALRKKLHQFLQWKKHTYAELINKKKFQLGYLRQHYQTIRMYMQWLRPYLKNLERLGFHEKHMDDPLLIQSFETSMIEIETIAARPPKEMNSDKEKSYKKDVYSVLLFTFEFRSKPSVHTYPKEHRGVIHVGRTECTIRAYGWTQEQIDNYRKYREKETLDTLKHFSQGVTDALDHLGEEFERFLKEAGETDFETKKKPEEKEEKKEPESSESATDLLVLPFKGMYEIVEPIVPVKKVYKWYVGEKKEKVPSKKDAEGDAKFVAYQCFKNYKKAHGMFSW